MTFDLENLLSYAKLSIYSRTEMRRLQHGILVIVIHLALIGCTQSSHLCLDPAGCIVIHSDEPIQIGVIAPLSGDRSCPEARTTLENLNQLIGDKKIKGHPLALSIWDTYSTYELMETALVELSAQPTLVAILVIQCQSTAQEEALLKTWMNYNYFLVTDPTRLVKGIAHLDSLIIPKGEDLILPRSLWRAVIIGDQELK
ncbi:hypothetical protein SE15_06035 [Thermanaerothrix daxensis]|uniref:Leucine-binding protein domain-containing protein n=1 Tax=Thermanaerothrix daxensis TaxID=869279 RepID=A0A0P6Y726_9CHLR|nr:hypothetical protein SE15_06035 [Thermanaerothrix daxensis]